MASTPNVYAANDEPGLSDKYYSGVTGVASIRVINPLTYALVRTLAVPGGELIYSANAVYSPVTKLMYICAVGAANAGYVYSVGWDVGLGTDVLTRSAASVLMLNDYRFNFLAYDADNDEIGYIFGAWSLGIDYQVRILSSALAIVRTFVVQALSATEVIGGLTYDSVRERYFVAHYHNPAPFNATLRGFNRATGVQEVEYAIGEYVPQTVVYGTATEKLYVRAGSSLIVVDAATGNVDTVVALTTSGRGLTYAPDRSMILAHGTLTLPDPQTDCVSTADNSIVCTVPGLEMSAAVWGEKLMMAAKNAVRTVFYE